MTDITPERVRAWLTDRSGISGNQDDFCDDLARSWLKQREALDVAIKSLGWYADAETYDPDWGMVCGDRECCVSSNRMPIEDDEGKNAIETIKQINALLEDGK